MRMRTTPTLALCLTLLMLFTGQSWAVTLIDDDFDDGDVGTNTTGTGTGFFQYLRVDGSQTESSSEVSMAGGVGVGTGGNHRSQLASREVFPVDGTEVTATFTVTDFTRPSTDNNGTTRHWLGFVDVNDTIQDTGLSLSAPGQNAVDGLWIGLQFNEQGLTGQLAGGDGNGKGILLYNDGNTRTVLANWEWDQSLVTWDPNSTIRSDRIQMSLVDDLTMELSASSTGYSLDFSTTGSGTLPANVSGIWADPNNPLTNDLSRVRLAMREQTGNSGLMTLDSVLVESDGALQPAGDVTGDLLVNSADFDRINMFMNQDVDPNNAFSAREQGDLSGDGRIDLTDFGIFKDDPSRVFPLTSAATSVPEPTALWLAACAVFCLGRTRIRI